MIDINYSVDKFYKEYYEICINRICRFGLIREDAEDIIQESLIKACENFDNTSSFNTYLYKIMSNKIVSYLNAKRKMQYCCLFEEVDNDTCVEDEVIFNDLVKSLPEAVQLWYEGYTYKEIAEKLNITVNQVKYELRKNNERFR